MSRSNTEHKERLAHKYFRWSSENECLEYFDKNITDKDNPKGTNVTVKLPFTFVPLDVLATIKGWDDASGSAIFSNEVKDLAKQDLVVKTFKNGEFATGKYAAIKDKVAARGGRFSNSVYIGYYEGKDFVIGNLQIVGASLGSWIDYCKAYPRYKDEGAVKITGATKEKKGATKYSKPIFENTTLSDATNALAVELDKQLQAYLKTYFGGVLHESTDVTPQEEIPAENNSKPVTTDVSDGLPF